ncbi:helix-turn-helix domain-containing protein [Streptomyces filamentosus]|uniref:helix-turn-helix domain-containing protein n=1 Tax=Streptomyces filamentosus TaxID=67294 RepID=UPI0033E936A5
MPKGPERTRVVSELRELYEGGISIRGIASVTDWSYSTVHRLLTEAGTVFRPVGGGSTGRPQPPAGGSG